MKKIVPVVSAISFAVMSATAGAQSFSLAGDFSLLMLSSSPGTLIQEYPVNPYRYQNIYIGSDATDNALNPVDYTNLITSAGGNLSVSPWSSAQVLSIYSLANNGDPGRRYYSQSGNYRYFTAAFNTPGVYSLTVNQGNGDPISAIYTTIGDTMAYDGVNPENNLYVFSDDSQTIASAPWTVYYNQTDTRCTLVQFVIYEYGGDGMNLTGSFDASGPGRIQSNCRVLGPNSTVTQESVRQVAANIEKTFVIQNGATITGLGYDCYYFNASNCVSIGARRSKTDYSQGEIGNLVLSRRINSNSTSRFGFWVDQNTDAVVGGGIRPLSQNSMVGLFAAWNTSVNNVGPEIKLSIAHNSNSIEITRPVYLTSQPGIGDSKLSVDGIQLTGKWGFKVHPNIVISPYTGVRKIVNRVRYYTENGNDDVTHPLTYQTTRASITTVLSGVELLYQPIQSLQLGVGWGHEHDSNETIAQIRASGVEDLTAIDFRINPVSNRNVKTLSIAYTIDKSSKLKLSSASTQIAKTVMAEYTYSF